MWGVYSSDILIYAANLVSNHVVTFAVDIISAIEFDKSGEHLATGDRGGRVVLFERTDGKEVYITMIVCRRQVKTCGKY